MKRLYLYSSAFLLISFLFWSGKKRPLHCDDFPKVVNWATEEISEAREKFFFEKEKLANQSFKLLEALDPYKINFDQSDVSKAASYLGTLQKLPLSKQCESLKVWIQKQHEISSQRLEKTIQQTPPYVIKKVSDLNSEELLENYAEKTHFPKNEAERKNRWRRFSEALLEREKKLAVWFEGNQKRVLKNVLENYFKKESSWEPILLQSYLQALDRFCSFFTEEHYQSFASKMSGSFEGLGLQLRTTPWGAFVESIHPQTPLSKLLKKGSVIVALNGKTLQNRNLEFIQKQINDNSTFEFSVKDLPNSSPRFFSYTKKILPTEETEIKSHRFSRREERFLWITVPSFYGRNETLKTKSSGEKVGELIQEAKKEWADKFSIVLDLRNNPGGYLEEALEMGSLFLGKKTIVRVKREHSELALRGRKPPVFDGPLTVIVDRESASSSEVLAAALLDHKRAIIMGEKSFGKGSVQRFFPLEDSLQSGILERSVEGKLKLTTHLFYSPLGNSPEKVGVQPEVFLQDVSVLSPQEILTQIKDSSSEATKAPYFKLAKKDKASRTL